MTTDDAGQALGISDGAVAKLCAQGKLPRSKKVRRPGTKRGRIWNVNGRSVRRRVAAMKRRGLLHDLPDLRRRGLR